MYLLEYKKKQITGTEMSALGRAAKNRKNIVIKKEDVTKPLAEPLRAKKLSWAQLLKKTFNIDMTKCSLCGGPTKLLGTVTTKPVTQKILEFLGIPADPPEHGQGFNGWGLFEEDNPYRPSAYPSNEYYGQFDGTFSEFGI